MWLIENNCWEDFTARGRTDGVDLLSVLILCWRKCSKCEIIKIPWPEINLLKDNVVIIHEWWSLRPANLNMVTWLIWILFYRMWRYKSLGGVHHDPEAWVWALRTPRCALLQPFNALSSRSHCSSSWMSSETFSSRTFLLRSKRCWRHLNFDLYAVLRIN